MSVETKSEWTCDWCGTRREVYGDKLPENWSHVELLGKDFRPGRDLCRSCLIRHREALKDLLKMAEEFWWGVHHKTPKASDAKPEPDID